MHSSIITLMVCFFTVLGGSIFFLKTIDKELWHKDWAICVWLLISAIFFVIYVYSPLSWIVGMFWPYVGYIIGSAFGIYITIKRYNLSLISQSISIGTFIVMLFLLINTFCSHCISYTLPNQKKYVALELMVQRAGDNLLVIYPTSDGYYQKNVPQPYKQQLVDNFDNMHFSKDKKIGNFLYRFTLNGIYDILKDKKVPIRQDSCRENILKLSQQVINNKSIPAKAS